MIWRYVFLRRLGDREICRVFGSRENLGFICRDFIKEYIFSVFGVVYNLEELVFK